MRIDFTRTPSPLLAVFVLACTSLADPTDMASAPPDDSMVGPGLGEDDPSDDRSPPPLPGPFCVAAGQAFASGSGVPSGDSCNYCLCYEGGVICTSLVCEPVVCAMAVEAADGFCSRFSLDPCKSQDPDCGDGAASCEAAGQSFPDGSAVPAGDTCNSCVCEDGSVSCTEIACDPVVCAMSAEASDGVCSYLPLDPCFSQDPDCSGTGAGTGGSCEAGGRSFPDGAVVPSGDSCNSCGCSDGNVACTRAVCEPVVCAQVVEVSDSVCSRFPLDPCSSQDPDCSDTGAAPGACEVGGQVFADGSEVPSGDTCNSCACNDSGVSCTELPCDLVFCAEFVEASDGVCSRFPLDPCSSQDPDCGGAP